MGKILSLFLWNYIADWDQTILEWSLGDHLSELCLLIQPANQGSRYQPT